MMWRTMEQAGRDMGGAGHFDIGPVIADVQVDMSTEFPEKHLDRLRRWLQCRNVITAALSSRAMMSIYRSTIVSPHPARSFVAVAVAVMTMAIMFVSTQGLADGASSLHINRAKRQLYVVDYRGAITRTFPCNIGRGGLRAKQRMEDQVTPTGDFVVDLILFRDAQYAAAAPTVLTRYPRRSKDQMLLHTRDGLAQLFRNMNALDFDRNGTPDQAYGVAYLGLDSTNAITGPKLHRFGTTPYWYSIAIHGMPDEGRLGGSTSGGCIHLPAEALNWLVREHVAVIGTRVTIRDTDP